MIDGIFTKGIDNLKKIGTSKQIGYICSLKYFLLYFILVLVSKEKKDIPKKIFFINGVAESERRDPTKGESIRIYARKYFKTFSDFLYMDSFVTLIPRSIRYKIFIKGMITIPSIKYAGRWIEYQLLKGMMRRNSYDVVCSYGHYDEFTYWLSSLCKKYGYAYEMYQHGIVLENIDIPFKICCDKIHVYDEYSRCVFEKKIVENSNCLCSVDGFFSSIVFKRMSKNKLFKYVGVVDQTERFSKWRDIVAREVASLDNVVVIVMLHPLTKKEPKYDEKNIIVTRDKYENLDCIICEFSSLILDYINVGLKDNIICTNKVAVENVFREYDLKYMEIKKLKKELRKQWG